MFTGVAPCPYTRQVYSESLPCTVSHLVLFGCLAFIVILFPHFIQWFCEPKIGCMRQNDAVFWNSLNLSYTEIGDSRRNLGYWWALIEEKMISKKMGSQWCRSLQRTCQVTSDGSFGDRNKMMVLEARWHNLRVLCTLVIFI